MTRSDVARPVLGNICTTDSLRDAPLQHLEGIHAILAAFFPLSPLQAKSRPISRPKFDRRLVSLKT